MPFKLSPQCTCILTIRHLVGCLIIQYSGSEGPEIRKMWKLDLEGSGVSHNKKSRDEDEYDVPSRDNNIEGGRGIYERCILK